MYELTNTSDGKKPESKSSPSNLGKVETIPKDRYMHVSIGFFVLKLMQKPNKTNKKSIKSLKKNNNDVEITPKSISTIIIKVFFLE